MGAFDEIHYEGKVYQTKSFPRPFQDSYKVVDSELWHQDYDTEDHSDPSAKGLSRLWGMCAAVNHRWARCDFTGTVYTWQGPTLIFEVGRLVRVRAWNEREKKEAELYD